MQSLANIFINLNSGHKYRYQPDNQPENGIDIVTGILFGIAAGMEKA